MYTPGELQRDVDSAVVSHRPGAIRMLQYVMTTLTVGGRGTKARRAVCLGARSLTHFLQGSASGEFLDTYSWQISRGRSSTDAGPVRIQITEWSGRRGSNSRPLAWQGSCPIPYSGGVETGL